MEAERREAIAEFLRARRARLQPSDVGLGQGSRRRTPGLRREEVSMLADVSTTWYTRLEQARAGNVSDGLLLRLAEALRLSEQERVHLIQLARDDADDVAPNVPISNRLQRLIDLQNPCPAYLAGRHCEILAWNRAAESLFAFEQRVGEERHLLWLLFADETFRAMFVNWEDFARDLVALFRANSARYVGDPWYRQFVDRLSRASPTFNELWQQYEVRCGHAVPLRIRHPIEGDLFLDPVTARIPEGGDDTLTLSVFVAPLDSASYDKLRRLGS